MNVIEMKQVTKVFGKHRALDGLDLAVQSGEVFGFIGPNGAGKSTAIRVLLGMLRTTEGTATIFGKDVWRDAVEIHRRIAYVPGDVNLWPQLTGGEVIDVFASLQGNSNEKKRDELLARFQLDSTKKCRTYSKGNRNEGALGGSHASFLIHCPARSDALSVVVNRYPPHDTNSTTGVRNVISNPARS